MKEFGQVQLGNVLILLAICLGGISLFIGTRVLIDLSSGNPIGVFDLSAGNPGQVTLTQIIINFCALFIIMHVLLLARFLAQFTYRAISFLLLLIPLSGTLLLFAGVTYFPYSYAQNNDILLIFPFVIILNLIVLLIWVTYELPLTIFYTVAILLVVPLSILLAVPSNTTGASGSPVSAGVLILFFVLCIALVLFPRRLQLSRYVFPYRTPRRDFVVRNLKKGFTLIEILIAIALINILSAGLLRMWGYNIQVQKEMSSRIQFAQILNSEMHAICASPLIDSTTAPQPLPIALTEFQAPENLSGEYYIEGVDEGLVRITVTLQHELSSQSNRHYRLVSYKRTSGRQTP
jgi:prepilin-type N-terminal cleavage/methylation domain-containing protein